MNRDQAKEILPIIQAYAEGKTIQQTDGYDWYDLDDPDFMSNGSYYRIKPGSEYRPFKNADECWEEMLKHQPFGWVKDKKDGHHALITAVDDDTCGMSLNGNAAWSLSGIMDLFTFGDGVPFGMKMEK